MLTRWPGPIHFEPDLRFDRWAMWNIFSDLVRIAQICFANQWGMPSGYDRQEQIIIGLCANALIADDAKNRPKKER